MPDKHNKFGPCKEKNCAWCCDPVRLPARFPDELIPKNSQGEPIWRPTGEVIIPEGAEARDMLKTYTCENFDEATKECKVYADRPDICRNTSCIDPNSQRSLDEQHQEVTEQKFTTIKKRL